MRNILLKKSYLLFILVFGILLRPIGFAAEGVDLEDEFDPKGEVNWDDSNTPTRDKRIPTFKGENVITFKNTLLSTQYDISIFKSESPWPRIIIRQVSSTACTATVSVMLMFDNGLTADQILCFRDIKNRKNTSHNIISEDFMRSGFPYTDKKFYLHNGDKLKSGQALKIELKKIKDVLDTIKGAAISVGRTGKPKTADKIPTHAIILDAFTEDLNFAIIRDPWKGVQQQVPMEKFLNKIPSQFRLNLIYPIPKQPTPKNRRPQ